MNLLPLPTVKELSINEFSDSLPFRYHIFMDKLPEAKMDQNQDKLEISQHVHSPAYRFVA